MIRNLSYLKKTQSLVKNIQRFAHFDFEDVSQLNQGLTKGFITKNQIKNLSENEIKAIAKKIEIPESNLDVQFVRSQGPGGQKVNKTASKAVIKLKIQECDFLNDKTKQQLLQNCQSRVNKQGELIISSQKTRDSHQNYKEAVEIMKQVIAENYIEEIERVMEMYEELPEIKSKRLSFKKNRSDVKKMRNCKHDY